jgi:hypothetical protein
MISREKGQTLADQWMCPFYETSAKNSINIEQVNHFFIRFTFDSFVLEKHHDKKICL